MSLASLLVRGRSVAAGALALALIAPIWGAKAEAATINVQPIVVCDDGGGNCAGNPLTADPNFASFTNQIFQQTSFGNTVNFLPVTQLNSTAFNSIDCPTFPCAELFALATGAGNGQSASLTTYNMWLVSDILTGNPNSILYGVGAYPGNGTVINDAIIADNRYDTLAHELAHNFGFAGTTSGHVSDPNFLMASGDIRTVPTALGEISTDGVTGLDRLVGDAPAAQVDTLGATPFQNPSFFNFTFNNSQPGVSLTSLVLDITPIAVNAVPPGGFFDPTLGPPGFGPTPLTFLTTNNDGINVAGCAGLTVGGITAAGDVDGGQVLTLGFTPGGVTAGCSFSFTIDIDLFSNVDGFGATPQELQGSIFEFGFSSNYTIAAALDQNVASTIFDPTKAPVTAFRFAQPDPVPLPSTLLLIGLGGLALAVWRRRAC